MEIVKTLLMGLTVAAVSVPAVPAQTRATPQVNSGPNGSRCRAQDASA